MIETLKVFGQQAPGAATEVDLYEVPVGAQALVSTISICNRGSTAGYFRLSVSVGGAATANKDYLYFDQILGPTDAFEVTKGITLGAGDVIRVRADLATFSFSAFGMERT